MSSAGVRMGNSVGDMTTKQQSAAHAEPIGVMPHFRRLLRSYATSGGVRARWYIQGLGGERHVDHCVTIGTPHHGTVAAYLGPGPAARDMRPGSDVIQRLERGFSKSKVKYVNLYSDLDFLIIPTSSALLPEQRNVHQDLIGDLGHTSLLVSEELIDQVSSHLIAAELNGRLAEVRPLRQ